MRGDARDGRAVCGGWQQQVTPVCLGAAGAGGGAGAGCERGGVRHLWQRGSSPAQAPRSCRPAPSRTCLPSSSVPSSFPPSPSSPSPLAALALSLAGHLPCLLCPSCPTASSRTSAAPATRRMHHRNRNCCSCRVPFASSLPSPCPSASCLLLLLGHLGLPPSPPARLALHRHRPFTPNLNLNLSPRR